MSLLDTLLGALTVAGGIVLGTLLTWIISYYVGKKMLLRLVRSLDDNPDIVKAIQALRKMWESDQNGQGGVKNFNKRVSEVSKLRKVNVWRCKVHGEFEVFQELEEARCPRCGERMEYVGAYEKWPLRDARWHACSFRDA